MVRIKGAFGNFKVRGFAQALIQKVHHTINCSGGL